MPLRLYNTRTHRVEEFAPLDAGRVRIYVCGLTPSAEGHLGHARSFLFFDVLRRYLEHPRNGYDVTYVQNVTDIDDRSIATAAREHTTYDAIVRRYYADFKAAMATLGVREPDREPYATHFIPQIVAMIAELLEREYAYVTDDGVYYRVAKFPRYGALSGKNVDELLVGARIAENEHKDDPLDFALWKLARPDEPRWDAPWGAGRPGWHIECSAMSRALLGVPFDIHGGGFDLIFPHHENEIAQSEPLMPHPPMANVWVHGGLLNYEGRKMSKSLGNFEPITALLDRHDPMAIRLLFLQTGYRKPMNFTEESISGITTALRRMQRSAAALAERAGGEVPPPDVAREALARSGNATANDVAAALDAIWAALDDDMDTSRAFAFLNGMLRADVPDALAAPVLALVRDAAGVLGIAHAFTGEAFAELARAGTERSVDAAVVARLRDRLGDVVAPNGESPEAAIESIIARRAKARSDRDFALGDRLREALAAEGIALKDSKDGTTWTVAGT